MWMHEHPPRLPIDKKIIADFERRTLIIKIDYNVIAASGMRDQAADGVRLRLRSRPVQPVSGLVAQYYNSKILAPIDYAAAGYGDEKGFTDHFFGGLDGIRFAGKYCRVPTEVSNYACAANNAMWKEAGLDPTKDFPKTWEEFPAIAEKLTKRDANGVPIRRGFDFNWPNKTYFWLATSTMMHQAGANLVDESSYTATIDNAAGKRVMQYWVDWANKYKLGGPQYTDSRTDFLGAKLATDCSFGVWGLPQFKDAKIDVTIKPAPRWTGSTVDEGFDAYAYYMMVNARSPAPVQKAAWKMVRFFSDHAARPLHRRGPVRAAQGSHGHAGVQIRSGGGGVHRGAEKGEIRAAHRRLRPDGRCVPAQGPCTAWCRRANRWQPCCPRSTRR